MKFVIIILFDILLLIKDTHGQELQKESDRRCEQGTRCVTADDCQDFLQKKLKLKTFERGRPQYTKLIEKLRETVCNKRARAVCCKIEAEEKCDDRKSCIPYRQCRYAEDIRAKYKNGDNATKDELLGLICNTKGNKICCSKDQETGIETTTTLTTSSIKTSTTTLTTSITTMNTNSTSSRIKTTTTDVIASTTTTASIKTSTTSTIIKSITTTSSIKTTKTPIKTLFNCSPNLCKTKDQCTIIEDLFRKVESTEDIFLLKAAKDELESRKCSPEINPTYHSDTYCCDPCPWDIMSNSCHDCACNMVGSVNSICTEGGTCSCKAGVTGLKCDQCDVQVRDVKTEDVMLLQTTVSVEESDLCPPGTNISVDVKPKPKQKYFLTAETPHETTSFVRHFTFTRLQEYVITVTVCDEVCKNTIKYHDTMEYKCGDVFDESIPHSKLCDDN